MNIEKIKALIKERLNTILSDLYEFSSLNGSVYDLTDRTKFIRKKIKGELYEDDLGNLLFETEKKKISVLIPIGIDDGYFATINKNYSVYKKNVYGNGIVDNMKVIIAILLSNIINEIDAPAYCYKFLFYRGQHSNYEGLRHYLKENGCDLAITFSENSINKIGIKPVNYAHIRIFKNSAEKDPYIELAGLLSEIDRNISSKYLIELKKFIYQHRKDFIPKIGYLDIGIVSKNDKIESAISEFQKFIVNKDFYYNVINKFNGIDLKSTNIFRGIFEEVIKEVSASEGLTLFPTEKSFSNEMLILNKEKIPSFSLGLFSYSGNSADYQEIIMPTINIGIKIFLSMLNKIHSLEDEIEGLRKIKKTK